MSIVLDILEKLWNTEIRYKGYTVNLLGVPLFKQYNPRSLETALYRLRKRRLVIGSRNNLQITNEGRKYLENYKTNLTNFVSPFRKTDPKNLLLMFDVPIERNKHRDWLRRQLKEFGYIMIQQSVWIGPSPLPKDFKNYVKEIGIQKSIRTFRLAKAINYNRSK